ncbi:MAG: Citronellyl-CoA dehydrogenase @ Acyl-CoA dehydrogenase, Mycobacterial subgroup FadE13 [uncultured Solirubrobacterales bacterium]|uniref:Citronellyl-CoA dehydrogenase @ Acyl-CoA dehydrogenase, Mycobacterial subgroup FadE13 n=1 Tax=uncultured Solirubrobacterales bacterium TaxID=768556 RepID=A0A6J4SVH8_9ACTN|nr:MAG: Citronellyl-CoA dehydrogenase @ Acyl-CoA dehydrogenase, Mycobacterial subgroup FadE13 [uncultured Solirubrobacterales bacterium]
MSTAPAAGERGLPQSAAPRPLPPFTEAHEHRRAELRAFVERELRPEAARYERERWFPNEVFTRLAAHGLLGLKYPGELGGEGGDHLDDAVFVEELARCGSGGLAAAIGAHTGIATPPVWRFGTPDQHERYLIPAIRGEKIAALGITEPGAGSDVASIRTTAKPVDGGYVVNGAKTYITNGVRADFVVTAVKTTGEGGHRGLSFLILERGMGGFSVSRKLEKLGWHASDTGELAFGDVFVPAENLLGQENQGFYLIMANFQWERLLMALGATGAMQTMLERTLALAEQGEARAGEGRQALRHAITEMAMKLETARTLTYDALRLFHHGHDAIRQVTMAKLLSQRSCYEVAETALRLHAEVGLHMRADGDEPDTLAELDRAARDARLGPIGGGTDEIMKEILGKQLGL